MENSILLTESKQSERTASWISYKETHCLAKAHKIFSYQKKENQKNKLRNFSSVMFRGSYSGEIANFGQFLEDCQKKSYAEHFSKKLTRI